MCSKYIDIRPLFYVLKFYSTRDNSVCEEGSSYFFFFFFTQTVLFLCMVSLTFRMLFVPNFT